MLKQLLEIRAGAALEAATEQPKPAGASETAQEKPKFTPEERSVLEETNASLREEHEKLMNVYLNILNTPAFSNQEKYQEEYRAWKAMPESPEKDQAERNLRKTSDRWKGREHQLSFLKEAIDQAEIKLNLPAERKLALAKLRQFDRKFPSLIFNDIGPNSRLEISDHHGIYPSRTILRDPIQFSEDGSCMMDTLSLSSKYRDEAVAGMRELPEGVLFRRCTVSGGDMLELVPHTVGELSIGRGTKRIQTPEEAETYSNQVKAFLQSERTVDTFVSTGEYADTSIYGPFVGNIRSALDALPVSQVKLKVGHDQNGYPKGSAFRTDTGNTPLSGYLTKAFPKQAK